MLENHHAVNREPVYRLIAKTRMAASVSCAAHCPGATCAAGPRDRRAASLTCRAAARQGALRRSQGRRKSSAATTRSSVPRPTPRQTSSSPTTSSSTPWTAREPPARPAARRHPLPRGAGSPSRVRRRPPADIDGARRSRPAREARVVPRPPPGGVARLVERTPEDQIAERVRVIDEADYSIHYHVWDPGEFRQLLEHARSVEGLPSTLSASGATRRSSSRSCAAARKQRRQLRRQRPRDDQRPAEQHG
jgi:hypothetical protein